METIIGQRRSARTLLVLTLVAVGIALGSVFLYVANLHEPQDILILDFINGQMILNAADREALKQRVIQVTLEDDHVQALTAGKDFTTYVTLTQSLQEMEEPIANDSFRRIYIEFDYVAVVTLIFEDGSGYRIPVNWEEWTVGEPEYAEHVSPPDPTIRIGPSDTRDQGGT